MTVVALVVLAVLLIVHYAGERDGGRSGADHTPALAANGQDRARLVVSGGTDRLTITAADLGGDLVQARTPGAQRAVPVIRESGDAVTVSAEGRDESGGGGTDLTVRLSRDVRWDVRVDGGTSLLRLDLGEARLGGVDVTQGVQTVDVRLPRPDGVLAARISGGAGAVRVVVPPGVVARATFTGGAGGADLDGFHHGGLSAGDVLTTPPGASGTEADRVDVLLNSGVGSLDLRHES
ncbi:hypothetical protein JCM9957A_52280 [Kineosporia succinea]